jgi:hypothetical protein
MTTAKTTKQTARDKGVPEQYLSESGKFRPGLDARYKSDLITEALDFEAANGGKKSSPAHKQLGRMGWVKHLDASRQSREDRAERKAAKAKAQPKRVDPTTAPGSGPMVDESAA